MDPDDRTADDRLALLARLDPAWSKAAEQLAGGVTRPLIDLHEELERRREQAEKGDSFALLEALATCCDRHVPAPQWLRDAYRKQLRAFTDPHAPGPCPCSLDEVFTSPYIRAGHPVRTQQDRESWALALRLWEAVRQVAPRHPGLDPALAAVLAADEWPVRTTTARKLVLLMDNYRVHLSSGRIRPLSRLWLKPRKQVQASPHDAAIQA